LCGSRCRGNDGEGQAEQDKDRGSSEGRHEEEQEAGANEGGGAATEEERRAMVGYSESPVVQTSTEWGEDAINGCYFDCRTWGEFEWTGSGRSSTCVRLAADNLRSGVFFILGGKCSIRYLWWIQ
jgi:hypothetical protein